ncbi:IS200/IS605 family transposase [candidate division WWE3 bacterium CG_4_8_14_3_um_filter_42_11]|uniref:IS200/IS605 family transposase n=1 Tax=candidate division WWE3 bacterium CG_4_8_14_3_um_filter_42_11 TaxID=1975076 RepID=A0A2M8G6Y4_UNCKA|nr:MAG: IS200/IS605 family transposase [candidate division WWE3 bacterium CG_4_8_14_3_um_filter_42_11]
MEEYKRTSHAIYFVRYHFCWGVKYRRTVITKLLGQYLRNVMKEIADSYGWEIITQGMETDHYHILICVQPRWSPAKVVEKLKSNSAKGVFRRFPDVKNRLWGGEFWADGYCITTVGKEMNADQIKKYIEKQDITIRL